VLANVNRALSGFTLPKLLDDAIYEVTPKGDIVWQWIAGDHLDEFSFTLRSWRSCANRLSRITSTSTTWMVGPNHWFRAGDLRYIKAHDGVRSAGS
jgi:hypothetical protein